MRLLSTQTIYFEPVYHKLLADTETPLSIYLKLAQGNFGSYLFESVVGGEKWTRYSIIGLGGNEWLKVIDHSVELWQDNRIVTTLETDNPLDFIQASQQKFVTERSSNLPSFNGGLVGYFGYETIRYIEKRLSTKPTKQDTLCVPDCILLLSIDLVVFDNQNNQIFLVTHAQKGDPQDHQQALKKIQAWQQCLNQPIPIPMAKATKNSQDKKSATEKPQSKSYTQEFLRHDYQQAVNTIKDYIIAGDVMQVVPSQRMSKPYHQPPINLYRALRHINPSPYMYFIEYGDFQIVGASPEILVRMENEKITVRPLAGTRKRGNTEQEDQHLEDELLNDDKEIAEHLMLIDLGRNDIGRICQGGTVKVTHPMSIERYSHVMHIVSNVSGSVRQHTHPIEVLKATFPAGTLSGAPKIRALEIIDELEPSKRGIYAGAVGYIGWHNNMDMAIAIRTAVIKDNTLYVQSGAGIVADSVAEKEWEETINKNMAMFSAAELSEKNFTL